MRRRQIVPPPDKATWADAYRVGLGLLMIPLGITILVRSISAGIVTPPAMLMGLLFIGFGVYRVYVGAVRYQMYRTIPRAGVAGNSTKPRG
jgi:hypothetical protein